MRRMARGALAIIAVLAFAAPSAAQELDDLALMPSSDAVLDTETGAVKVAVQPGGGVWQSATLTNRSSVRFSVRLEGVGDDETGTWIRPAIDTMLLEPGKSQTVDFTIAPPSNASHDAYASLVATAIDAPDVTKRIDVLVELIGEPVASANDNAGAVRSTPQPPSEMKPAKPQGNRTADTILLIAIVASLAVLGIALLVPVVVGARRRIVRPLVDLASERHAESEHLRSVLGTTPAKATRDRKRRSLDVAALQQDLARRA